MLTAKYRAVVLTTSGLLYAAIAVGAAVVPSVWRMGRAPGSIPSAERVSE